MSLLRPTGVTIIGYLLAIQGIIFLLTGMLMILTVIGLVFGIVFLIFGILTLWFAKGLLDMEQWAWSMAYYGLIFMLFANIYDVFQGKLYAIIEETLMVVIIIYLWKIKKEFFSTAIPSTSSIWNKKSEEVGKFKCPECGSLDLTIYTDGIGYCNSCSKVYKDRKHLVPVQFKT